MSNEYNHIRKVRSVVDQPTCTAEIATINRSGITLEVPFAWVDALHKKMKALRKEAAE